MGTLFHVSSSTCSSKQKFYDAIEDIRVPQLLQYIIGTVLYLAYIIRMAVYLYGDRAEEKECLRLSWKYT